MDQQEAELVKDRTVLLMLKHNKDVSLLQALAVDLVVEQGLLDKLAPPQLEEQTARLAQVPLHVLANILYL